MEEAEILLRNAMEHHGAAVYRLALCRMQSVQDAEDVYQDVFLRLLGQEASAWDGEHLRAWLLRCTVNRCHDLHRFRLRRPVLALADLPETAAEVVIDHGDGLSTLYGQCRDFTVEEGDTVRAGEMIGAVGKTGMATGAHLHFEVRQDGEPQNPVAYFDSDVRDTLRMG